MKEISKLIERFNKLTTNKLVLLDYGVTMPHYYTVTQQNSCVLYHFKSCKEFREIMKAYKDSRERIGLDITLSLACGRR